MTELSYRKGIEQKKLRNILIKELFRKMIHLCSAFITLILYYNFWAAVILLGSALVVYSLCELIRLKGGNVPVVSKITEIASRKRDENKFVLGPVTLVIGILCCIFLWSVDFRACQIGIFALSFGDGLASLTGKFLGRAKVPFTNGKTAAGSLACFFAVFVSSYCVCGNCLLALIFAVCATILEVFPLKDLDNILIPVIIGGIAYLLLGYFLS